LDLRSNLAVAKHVRDLVEISLDRGELAALALKASGDVLSDFGPAGPENSGALAHVGDGDGEPFISVIGGLLPIALCGRTSL
jgi:hypothetical protein